MDERLKNQTALQEFIEAISNSGIVIINQTLIDNCLQMEKQQIIDCFVAVSKANCETFKIPFTNKDEKDFTVIAENYFEETYKK